VAGHACPGGVVPAASRHGGFRKPASADPGEPGVRLRPGSARGPLLRGELSQRSRDITGRVLEVGDDTYTRQFGDGVVDSEVLHLLSGSTRASVVADLTAADNIPDDSYDCLILTQTLHLIYDVRAAVRTIERVLRPGGVLLATFPGITPISADAWSAYWCWAFTPLSATRLFHEVFKPADVTVEAFGNVLAATAFLQGLAAEELTTDELEVRDARYPVLVALRAVKGCGEPEPG
jgi:SAM-dependent methyltransferase